MDENLLAFIIWGFVGVLMICIGLKAFVSKKPVGFWTNIKTFSVQDIKGYNKATGKLFIFYGVIFIGLGIPLLLGNDSPYILLSVIGVMLETIVIMAIYILCIEKKYKENKKQKTNDL